MDNKKKAPATLQQLKKRKSIAATVKFPDVKIELERIWQRKGSIVVPTIQQVEAKQPYVIIEATSNSFDRELAPSIAASDMKRIGKQSRIQETGRFNDGIRQKFHNLSFQPKLIKKINARKIRPGEDLPINVFGTDTRYIFRDSAFPWCTVGRVETPAGVGSGTMIGKNLLLTCSHVIQWNSDGSAGWVKFSPAYYNGPHPSFGTAWGTRVVFWNKAQGGLSDLETAFDYVVVVLDRNMGDLTGYPGYRTYDSGWNDGSYWQTIGYPGDLTGTERPAFFGNGAISSVSSQSTSGQTGYVLGHFMDITGGHSGGPVWGWWGNEPWPRVVGVQSAEASTPANNTSGDNEFGGGPALSRLITYSRDNF
jgi:V8-like Glu-specific endopeptidase